jgi:hypothetical protein
MSFLCCVSWAGLEFAHFDPMQKGDPKVARFLCSGDLPNDLEISAAAMVHPNTAAVVTPTPALPA